MKPTTQNSTRSTMRTKFSRALVWPIAVAAALAACTQDLNITNPNAPHPANFWRTEADAISGINAVYSGLEQRGTYQRWLAFAYDIRSDEGMSLSPWTELRQWNGFVPGDFNFEPSREIWWHHYWTRSNRASASPRRASVGRRRSPTADDPAPSPS